MLLPPWCLSDTVPSSISIRSVHNGSDPWNTTKLLPADPYFLSVSFLTGMSLRLLNIESQNGKHLNLWRTPGRPSANQDLLACQASLRCLGSFDTTGNIPCLTGYHPAWMRCPRRGMIHMPMTDWKDIIRGSVCFLAMIEDNTDFSSPGQGKPKQQNL